MFSICHHYDQNFDRWVHLAEAFNVAKVYVIGLPKDLVRNRWVSISTVGEVAEEIVAFQPETAPKFPGTLDILDFDPPETCCYVFGSDDRHNDEIPDVPCVYIKTPKQNVSLYAEQAALIALQHRYTNG